MIEQTALFLNEHTAAAEKRGQVPGVTCPSETS
jgi:hypothetical protein